MRTIVTIVLGLLFFALPAFPGDINNLPANTWVRLCSAPGDAKGREVPPGRASTWVYEPKVKKLFRYGGYTPTFTNALFSFNPADNAWTVVRSHDETFPATRPGGGCRWFMAYDPARRVVWLGGGWRSAGYTPAPYDIGDQGIWKYDASADVFTKVGTYIGWNTCYALDPVNDVIVTAPIAPSLDTKFAGKTYIFNLKTNAWEIRTTVTLPQEFYSGGHPMIYDPSIGKVVLVKDTQTWTYDAAANVWTPITTTGTPPTISLPALAYDPDHQIVMLYGGSDGQYYDSYINDSYIYKSSTQTWTKLSCPGLPKLDKALLYPVALCRDPEHHCFLLTDPDLGVWAFKYDPAQPMGTTVVDAQTLATGQAAHNQPASGPAENLRTFPSPLNSRLVNMADNSLLILNGTSMEGAEIMWTYDSDHGLIFKYGGCGNSSCPFWEHYGNNLDIYDPGTEKCMTRRVSEVGGAGRPGTGCTRSVVYDSRRKLWWMFGGASSGPYNPAPAGAIGPYAYDVDKDTFIDFKKTWSVDPGNPGQNMSYDPDHDISIVPASGSTYVFHFETAIWEKRNTPVGPGPLYAYNRTVYISSLKRFFCLQSTDGALQAWTYDPVSNIWENKTAGTMPPHRTSKLGLSYDSNNDVVVLVGGQIGWNGTPLNDLWVYHPGNNAWEQMNPVAVNGQRPGNDCAEAAYDSRHNVHIIANSDGGTIFAYRYKMVSSTTRKTKTEPGNRPGNGASITKVFDLMGREISTLTSKNFQGQGTFIRRYSKLPTGVFIVQRRSGHKMVEQQVIVECQ